MLPLVTWTITLEISRQPVLQADPHPPHKDCCTHCHYLNHWGKPSTTSMLSNSDYWIVLKSLRSLSMSKVILQLNKCSLWLLIYTTNNYKPHCHLANWQALASLVEKLLPLVVMLPDKYVWPVLPLCSSQEVCFWVVWQNLPNRRWSKAICPWKPPYNLG